MITLREHLKAKGIVFVDPEEAKLFRLPKFKKLMLDEIDYPPLPSLCYPRKETFKHKIKLITIPSKKRG